MVQVKRMRTISFSDARSNLKQVLDRVVEDADATIITRRDAEDVVVISLDTWNSWQETEYLLSSPANARRLAQSLAELNEGKGIVRELVEPEKAWRVQEPQTVYEVESKIPRKRRATTSKSPLKKRG
jgi:antitoxin YefM